jgi:hypothetical protein
MTAHVFTLRSAEECLTWETSLTDRMRFRQRASQEAGPSREVQVVAPCGKILDSWIVPAVGTDGAW